jgi:hypothetical protein
MMRKIVVIAIALAGLAVGYWAWALFGAAQLAKAGSSGDVDAMTQRIDLSSLRRSIGSQIVRAYLNLNPKLKNLSPLARGLAGSVGVSIADAMLNEALTPESVAALLNEGRLRKSGISSGETVWKMAPLADAFRSGPFTAAMNSYFDSPIDFVVTLNGGDGIYGVHLRLSGMTWMLSGLDIPSDVADRLAHQIAAKQNS